MKILLLALPRTGSKFVCDNIARYLGDPSYTYTDMYNGATKHKLLSNVDGAITITDELVDHASRVFFENRINAIRQSNKPVVAKIHPERIFMYDDLMTETIKLFDRVYIVERRDLFNQLLSQAISINTNTFIPGSEMNKHKLKMAFRPVMVDTAWWASLIENYKSYSKIDFGQDIPTVYADDLFSATDLEFCERLDLPPTHFDMHTHTVELGDKRKFVKNYNELKEIFWALI